jgi:hypothetical protein
MQEVIHRMAGDIVQLKGDVKAKDACIGEMEVRSSPAWCRRWPA